MATREMELSESDPAHPGFTRKYYAAIEAVLSNAGWGWAQLDGSTYIQSSNQSFLSEDEAYADALMTLSDDEYLE